MTIQPASFLATRRGGLTLLLPCAVQVLDVAVGVFPGGVLSQGHRAR